MRVGLIGWFGHHNAGDERIFRCMKRLLAGDELVVARGYGDAALRRHELNRCDFVLLGGGGLVVRGLNRYAGLFESLVPPLACLGLGVEARHADNEAFVQVLLDRCEFILVRDAASQTRLRHHPKVLRGPDLTFLDPLDVAEWSAGSACALNLRPWPFWRAEFQGRCDRLMGRLSRRIPGLKTIYPLPKWDARRVVDTLRRRFPEIVPTPLYCPAGTDCDRTVLGRFFHDVPGEFLPAAVARCRWLVGMRLHSLIFACQMGIPFVSLSYQPKNEAFCEDIGMPFASVSLYDPGQLEPAVATMIDQGAEIRRRLIEIRDESSRAIRQIVEPLVRRVHRAVSPEPVTRSA